LDSYYYYELHGFEDDGYLQFNNYERISEPQNITDNLMLEDFFEFEADNTVYAAIKRKNTKNKILFMIDPFETDENIMIKMKEIKNHIIKSVKTNVTVLRRQGKVLLESSKMDKYLKWFERYDEIIDKAKEMAQNESQKNYKHKSLLRCF